VLLLFEQSKPHLKSTKSLFFPAKRLVFRFPGRARFTRGFERRTIFRKDERPLQTAKSDRFLEGKYRVTEIKGDLRSQGITLKTDMKSLGERLDSVSSSLREKLDTEAKSLRDRIDTESKSLREKIDSESKDLRNRIDPLSIGIAELKVLVASNTATLAGAKTFFQRVLVVLVTAVVGLLVRAAWEWWN
jgi:hypothetical protein